MCYDQSTREVHNNLKVTWKMIRKDQQRKQNLKKNSWKLPQIDE